MEHFMENPRFDLALTGALCYSMTALIGVNGLF